MVPDEKKPEKNGQSRKKLAAMVAGIVIVGMIGYTLKDFFADKGERKKSKVQQISLIKPPPPPPPPEKKPEPEIKKEEVKIDQPKPDMPKPDNPPDNSPAPRGIDGPEGTDGFGMQRGTWGEGGSGEGGEGGGVLGFAFYTGQLQEYLQQELAKNDRLRESSYRIRVRLWLTGNGTIERVELDGSSGLADLDDTLRHALQKIAAMREPPPANIPQPIKMRISNHGAS